MSNFFFHVQGVLFAATVGLLLTIPTSLSAQAGTRATDIAATAPSTQPEIAATAPASQPAIQPATALLTEPPPPPPFIGKHQDELAAKSIEGDWLNDEGADRMRLTFERSGDFYLDSKHGIYRVESNRIFLIAGGVKAAYEYELTADTLILRGGDLRKDTKFTRQSNVIQYVRGLFDFSLASFQRKFFRIASILAIVLAARLIIFIIRGILLLLVVSDRGPLGFIWRNRKSRAMTIHSLVLNVITYVIYFTALGFILSELGINYTTYVASLSVIGLAIGFGSQGLVQDMVTGMFVIFEEQFGVGDMVELSGQVGVVEELGLRSTKLYNYLGQAIIIPNRFIAVVGNFSKGAQQATIDVAIPSPAVKDKAIQIVTEVGDELYRQFKGAIIAAPEVVGLISLATDEHFVRLQLAIWPKETWVIEQQFVPRVLETLKRGGIEVPNNRVAVYYHAREMKHVFNWGELVTSIRRRFENNNPGPGDEGEGGDVDV